MTVRQGSNIIAGVGTNSISNAHTLLDFKWSDHKLYDISWLRADTFSWQNGELYQGAYQHLVADLESIPVVPTETYYAWKNYNNVILYTKTTSPTTSTQLYEKSGSDFVESTGTIDYTDSSAIYVTYRGELEVEFSRDASSDESFGNAQTETIAGITIEYVTATDGHKIVLPSQETAVEQIYQATGVAWYYIVDTTNQRFKLPRSKALTSAVKGNGMTLGITDGTNNKGLVSYNADSYTRVALGANINYYGSSVGTTTTAGNQYVSKTFGITTDSTKSGIVVERAETDQCKYLYFYVGEYSRSAVEQTAGLNSELFNQKADADLSNINASAGAKETIVDWGMPDYESGVSRSFATTYTESVDGWIFVNATQRLNCQLTIGGKSFYIIGDTSTNYNKINTMMLPIPKGTSYSCGNQEGGQTQYVPELIFYPCKGVL